MPLVIIRTSAPISEESKKLLFQGATDALVEATGRDEKSHVTVLLEKVEAYKGGVPHSVAVVEIRSMIAFNHPINHKLSEKFCDLFENVLGIPDDKVTVHTIRIPEGAWGWKHGIVVWDHEKQKWLAK